MDLLNAHLAATDILADSAAPASLMCFLVQTYVRTVVVHAKLFKSVQGVWLKGRALDYIQRAQCHGESQLIAPVRR